MNREQMSEKIRLLSERLRSGTQAAAAVAVLSRSLVAESKLDDADILSLEPLYPEWGSGNALRLGDVVRHRGKLYRVLQPHTAQDDWAPDRAINLFSVVQPGASSLPLPWTPGEIVEPGDERLYGGQLFQCLQGHMAQAGWEPPGLPALWRIV